jgi:hypothetical protein
VFQAESMCSRLCRCVPVGELCAPLVSVCARRSVGVFQAESMCSRLSVYVFQSDCGVLH